MSLYLVGCDGSDGSLEAVRWAALVASRTGAEVCAFATWAYSPGAGLPTGPTSLPSPADMDERVSRDLDRWLHDALGDAAGSIERKVGRGPATSTLVRAANEARADLLVVGSRGADASSRLVLGSVSERCVEESLIPVVVVPSPEVAPAGRAPERIVVGYDGSEASGVAVEWAGRLAAPLDAEVVVVLATPFALTTGDGAVLVPQPPEEAAEVLEAGLEPLRGLGVRHRGRLEAGDARAVLPTVADDEEASLVVVGTRGMGKLPRLLVGSVAQYVVNHVDRPVVVVPDPSRARLLASM
jgi:nucleotide-binding universal stress UspA family protein